MNIEVITIALFIVSVLSNLTVQGIKKMLDGRKYSANLLAMWTSVVLCVALAIIYVVVTGVAVTPVLIAEVIVLMYLSFLVATNGYDKVVQTLAQIKSLV